MPINIAKSTQELTNKISYEGPIKTENIVKQFINNQFKGKNKMAVPKPQAGDVITAFSIYLPNEVPYSTKWIDGLNKEFWKQNPELKDRAGFGY